MAESAEQEQTVIKEGQKIGPVRAGIMLFFADFGMTVCFGIIVGIIFLLAGFTANQITGSWAVGIAGILISAYAAFLLYKNYSKDRTALITLVVTSIIFSILDLCFTAVGRESLQLGRSILEGLVDVVAYLFGWYLASTTNFKIFLFGKKWTIAFFVIGIVAIAISWLGMIGAGAK